MDYSKMVENKDVFNKRKARLSLDTALGEPYLILLNKHNSDIVEEAIKNDYAYIDYLEMVCYFIKTHNKDFPKKR